MKKVLLYSLLLLSCFCANSQNLVSNPGFERAKKIPRNWSSNEHEFHDNIYDWTSPNGGSPDLFFVGNMGSFFKRPNVDVKNHAPRSGKYMVGIKTYGCANTMHCKEYLQTKLKSSFSSWRRILYRILGKPDCNFCKSK
ncbi:MAG: hypothetical protein HC892_00510 [Saprospiraceae bacterium]|nr:hypothetical protein [Saprospiraceae bacterium]